ncbi:MAG: tRNA (cytidine(56)-2'-O)-methyltransferase [Candidatus Diapherotrites archaeon]
MNEKEKEAVVLRYGHRIVRDARVTTHCCLVARAFGAKKIIICGDQDNELKERIEKLNREWGGEFAVCFSESWRKTVTEHKEKGFFIVHNTMYGQPIQKKEKEIKKHKKILVVIGSQKVEKEVYEKADMNISVTSQPHSEIAALALTLDRIFEGKELEKKFSNEKKKIIPSKKGKIIKSKE